MKLQVILSNGLDMFCKFGLKTFVYGFAYKATVFPILQT